VTTDIEIMTIVDALQRQVANAFALYLNYKRYHWYTYGPHFRDLHLLFDSHAEQTLESLDELGERIRILGGNPVATLQGVEDTMSVLVPTSTEHSVRTMIDEAIANHRRVITEMREAVALAARGGDPGTADLFTRLVQGHEKQEWFLREVADRTPDGLQA
jgi:starvation-inducible DNA-binding protein